MAIDTECGSRTIAQASGIVSACSRDLAARYGSVDGQLKLTEQGEVISDK